MKLPTRVKTGVQSLGRQSVPGAAAPALARAGAISQVSAGASRLSAQLEAQSQAEAREKADAQTREAALRMSDGMVQFENRYGNRETFSADELPESVKVRRTEKATNPDGSISEVPRTAIPAYEVRASAYETYARNVAEASASVIDDENVRAEWLTRANIGINDNYVSRLQSDRKQQKEFLDKQLNVQIESALQANQYDAAEVLAEDITDPERRAAVNRTIRRTRELDSYHGMLSAETDDVNVVRDMESAILELSADDYSGSLSPQERSAMVSQLKSATARNYMSIEATKKRDQEAIVSGTWEAIIKDDPEINEATVDALFQKGIINGGTRTSMIRALVSNRESAVKKQVVNIDLDTVALSPYGIDPKDKDMRKAVDERFKSYSQSMEPGDAAVRIMREFKVVPSQVQSIFRANNRADARGLTDAVEMYRSAMKYAPQSMKDFKDNDLDVISRVAANMDLGMPAADAIEAVRSWESMTPQQREALDRNNKVFEEENIGALEDKVSDSELYQGGGLFGFFQGTPDVPALMHTEYSSAVSKYLPSVGYSIPVAQQLAFHDVSKKWHRVEINGKPELMKNAPMGSVDEIRAAVRSQYTGRIGAIREAYGSNVRYDDIRISSDQLTALEIEAGKTPTYRAYVVVDKDTQQIEFLGRFQWDPEKAAAARREQILQEAEAKRTMTQEATTRILNKEIVL